MLTKRQAAWHGSKWIRKEKRMAIYERDGLCCVYCGASIEEQPMSLDHLVAVELGGTNEADNLVTCCKLCNSAKGKKSVKQFLNYLRGCGRDTSKVAAHIRAMVKRSINYGRSKR